METIEDVDSIWFSFAFVSTLLILLLVEEKRETNCTPLSLILIDGPLLLESATLSIYPSFLSIIIFLFKLFLLRSLLSSLLPGSNVSRDRSTVLRDGFKVAVDSTVQLSTKGRSENGY